MINNLLLIESGCQFVAYIQELQDLYLKLVLHDGIHLTATFCRYILIFQIRIKIIFILILAGYAFHVI